MTDKPQATSDKPHFRTGTVALIGKPNVGKSTLLNTIVGQKVSIVSSKPQTTRRRILGISTTNAYQIVFIDTPGIHEAPSLLNRRMMDTVRSAVQDRDVVLDFLESLASRQGTSIVFSSRRQHDFGRLADSVLILDGGRAL